ncbi:polysaccharide biosynthesis protein [Bacillus massiliigorillae]|uniref:polysaccharide biosynthesis protein n=1 Tax=Bacillus massiliigorillae TaxID=1243664 RepID=UPI0003A9103F|nr:nucleoside-diphosphate sugar epimerase/dehydratase [Bacillus massiliigorillae]
MNYQRLSLLLFVDTILVLAATFISHLLLFSAQVALTKQVISASLLILLCHYFFSFIYRLYQKAWEYASIRELVFIFKTVSTSIVISSVIQLMLFQNIDIRLVIVNWLLYLFFIGGSRFCWRIYRDSYLTTYAKKRTLIIGAGSAGTMVARQLKSGNVANLLPVAFIDDNYNKQKLDILGVPVVGKIKNIEQIVQELNIEHIIIAIPSLNRERLNIIFQECAKTDARTQILPMLEDLLTGKLSVTKFRDVQVEDILGREPVQLDMESISECITNQVILVTGAGGSIGSEICRQIAQFNPKQLILLGHGENSIYTIEMELKETYKHSNIEFLTEIADIQDEKKMFSIMAHYLPNVVYHAAAHKHVPLMERNPEEAVKNNLIGTSNVAKAASWHNVQVFVMISSDKAVNPTSVMGATKKLSEMLIQQMNEESKTKFVVVRFGNVLGSRGSVIPLFTKQIENGGPVTVTDPNMERYFMTIPEASRLVIQSGVLAQGGEIFVLDMGEPVKIVDLARNLIKLSGHTTDEIEIKYIGIRQGEKLFEELLNENEIYDEQVYPNIYVGKARDLYISEIEDIIANYAFLEKDILRKKIIETANLKKVSHSALSIS